jgi:3-hydroxyacyl-[acyl-carrier-protein] dehydratase
MVGCTVAELNPKEVLELLPQQAPFRFVDEIVELDEEHIVATYRFKKDEDFYRGHFPGNPITPGVILIETMAQAGIVALGIYLFAREASKEELANLVTVFTDTNVDFNDTVLPGERVTTTASKIFWRRKKLRVAVEMRNESGTVVCSGEMSGMGVMRGVTQ